MYNKSIQIGFLLSLLLLSGITLSGYSQTSENPLINQVKPSPKQWVQKIATVNLAESPEDPWQPMMYNTVKIHEQGDAEREEYLKAKAAANAIKEAMRGQNTPSSAPSHKVMGDPPIQGNNFFGNTQDGIPNDNAIAVSRDGFVVSATNSKVQIYDENGVPKLTRSLSAFIATTGTKFDPKVTYDPDYDRFVLLFLNGDMPIESKIIVCFSETNDPTGDWNVYAIDGNPDPARFGNVWTDFCQVGLSTHEFFFAGNLFLGSGGSSGRMAWQIDKVAGYNGVAQLPMLTYPLSGSTTFALCPAEGSKWLYGPNFYFVSSINSPFGTTSTVYLHEITDSIGGNPEFNTYQINTFPGYGLSPDGDQMGTNIKLDVRDSRVRSAYFHQDRLVFGLNANANGNSGIYLGEISGLDNPSFASCSGRVIRIDSMDISFPGLAYAGSRNQTTGELSTLVFFNFGSINHFPGNGALIIDENGQQSAPTILKYGFTYIDMGSSTNLVRWGDYTTSDWRNLYAGEIWAAGYLGYNSSSHSHGTWISQIFIPNLPAVSVEPREERPEPKMTVFPNPTTEFVKVEFEVPETAVYTARFLDASGKELKVLMERTLYKGVARSTFYTDHLASGLYFLEVSRSGEQVFIEKVMVNR